MTGIAALVYNATVGAEMGCAMSAAGVSRHSYTHCLRAIGKK